MVAAQARMLGPHLAVHPPSGLLIAVQEAPPLPQRAPHASYRHPPFTLPCPPGPQLIAVETSTGEQHHQTPTLPKHFALYVGTRMRTRAHTHTLLQSVHTMLFGLPLPCPLAGYPIATSFRLPLFTILAPCMGSTQDCYFCHSRVSECPNT